MATVESTYHNVIKDLREAQSAERDGREKAREADHFINARDGQWEPNIVQQYEGKPRYTIDLTSGIVSDAHGEMSSMEFSIAARPAGGPATTDIALHYEGLIRNIENNSGVGAKYIYRAAGRQMLTGGIGGWGVKQGYRDPFSFDQDLIIYPISNFVDRVWFDPNAELPDASDANWGFKLTSMSLETYKRDFPKGSGMSLSRDSYGTVYSCRKDNEVIVGERYWRKAKTIELVRMTNGSVFVADEEFDAVKDELAEQGVTVEKTRESEAYTVYHQLLDGGDFLTGQKETVFTYVPLVPVYGNFEISEGQLIYWGLVEKHMDPQRILNYIESRKVAEGALAPRAKKWMTKEQAAGHEPKLRTLNTNNDPVQFYNHIPDHPAPFETGGAQINPGLSETSASMNRYMQTISGRVDPSGDPDLGLQSGVALEALQNKGDTGNVSYFTAMEVAIAHTCRIVGDAIPRTYDAQREVQLDFQDGSTKSITINQKVFDKDTQKVVELNDLSKGTYSFKCSSGPAFHNRQQETVTAINNIAAIDPSILQTGGDVLLNNIPAPGMDKLAKRKRAQMIAQGLIPENELTPEEVQQLQKDQAAAANQPPSAMDQALIATAEADREKAQAGTAEIMSKIDEREKNFMLAVEKFQLETQKTQADIKNNNSKLILDAMKAQDEQIKVLADTLKVIKEAIGADAIVGPANTRSYEEQSKKLLGTIVTSD